MSESIYDSFAYYIPANETFYKGMDIDIFNTSYNKPSWYSINKNTAQNYGNFIHKILSGRILKLINIMSTNFSIFLQDFLIDKYKDTDLTLSYKQHMNLLVPLGLPDLSTQLNFIKSEYNINPISSAYFNKYASLFNNRSRFSMDKLDKELIDIMKARLTQYGYDGYISLCNWPSVQHNEFFHDELCLFDSSKCNLYTLMPDKSTFQRKVLGGGLVPGRGQFISPEPINMNEISIKTMRLLGYTGKIEYDNAGNVIPRDDKWIQDWRAEKNRKKYGKITGTI